MSQSLSPELQARVEAVEAFVHLSDRLFEIRAIEWSAVKEDYRLLAINGAFRRQLESIKAAIVLTRQGLGHLAVPFVRPALEDLMYLGFFLNLDRAASQELFILLGRWDGLRALLAQKEFIGDKAMEDLWYTAEFLDSAESLRNKTRDELKELQGQYRWRGGTLPSNDWIADQAGQRQLYDYLHSATSRAVHFSAGEIMRRGWGSPTGKMATDSPVIREHLADFTLFQLVLLFFHTWHLVGDEKAAGIIVSDDVEEAEVSEVVKQISVLGQVPLVHAGEWNLRPREST
jgi:hypothetical protein